jgi:hypothetical protein
VYLVWQVLPDCDQGSELLHELSDPNVGVVVWTMKIHNRSDGHQTLSLHTATIDEIIAVDT